MLSSSFKMEAHKNCLVFRTQLKRNGLSRLSQQLKGYYWHTWGKKCPPIYEQWTTSVVELAAYERVTDWQLNKLGQ